jgi:hypothetical protein
LFRNSLFGATIALIVLTVIVTWPQALHLASAVPDHDDPFFSMWRLAWIAHALPRDPSHLFDGNIFYPHLRTLAYSDATLFEGLLAAPWLWAHVNLVLVYNLCVLAGIVSSGVGMFVLVRHLTNDPDAALVAAAIFALAPYRIEHVMHLELQWTMWMPLAFYAVHRLFDQPSARGGVILGAALAFQLLASVYYGVFLSLLIAAFTVMLVASRGRQARPVLLPLCVAAVTVGAVAAAYALPYIDAAREVGTRAAGETASFSARLGSYLSAPEQNWLWGWTSSRFQGNELRLFPGLVAVLIAVTGVAGNHRDRLVWFYLAILVLAIELSLGMNGIVYAWLYSHVSPLRGFRAPARFGILAVCALAVLAGFGFRFLQRRVAAPRALLVAALVAIGVEGGSAPLRLTRVQRSPPDVYTVLDRFLEPERKSAVIELPMASGFNVVYMFWSSRHWRPLVNGYSGYAPRDFEETVKCMDKFPDAASMARLRALNVGYILLHGYYYPERERTALVLAAARSPDLVAVGKYRDWIGITDVFALAPATERRDARLLDRHAGCGD